MLDNVTLQHLFFLSLDHNAQPVARASTQGVYDLLDQMLFDVSGVEGLMRSCCEKTLGVLRQNKESLITIIEVQHIIYMRTDSSLTNSTCLSYVQDLHAHPAVILPSPAADLCT